MSADVEVDLDNARDTELYRWLEVEHLKVEDGNNGMEGSEELRDSLIDALQQRGYTIETDGAALSVEPNPREVSYE